MKSGKRSPMNQNKNISKPDSKSNLVTQLHSDIPIHHSKNNFSRSKYTTLDKQDQQIQGSQLFGKTQNFMQKKSPNKNNANSQINQQSITVLNQVNHSSNKSLTSLQNLTNNMNQQSPYGGSFNLEGSLFENIQLKQVELDSKFKSYEVDQLSFNSIQKERLDNLEQILSNCFKILFERQNQIDSKIQNIEMRLFKSLKSEYREFLNTNQRGTTQLLQGDNGLTFPRDRSLSENENLLQIFKSDKKLLSNIQSNYMSKVNINLNNFNTNSCTQSSRMSGVHTKKNTQVSNRDKPFSEYKGEYQAPPKLTKNQSFTEKRGILRKDRSQNDENFNPLLKQHSGVPLVQAPIDSKNLTTMIESSRNFKLTMKKDSNANKQTTTNSTSKSIVPEKKINLTRENRNSNSTQELRILQQQAEENILTTKDECFKTIEGSLNSTQQVLKNGKQTERQKKNKKLIDNYQKNVPTKVNNLKTLNLQRPSTSNEKRMNNTHQILNLPQNSLIAKTVNKQTMIEVSKGNNYFQSNNSQSKLSLSSQSGESMRRNSLDLCKSMLKPAEDSSSSPKFINHINKSDNKTELKLRLSENGEEMLEPKQMIGNKFRIDNELHQQQNQVTLEFFQEQPRFERTRNVEHKFFDTIISKEDQSDFDEKKVEFVNKQTEDKDQDEFQSEVLNKLSANSVYQSKNMGLSRFISNNKSQIDFKNHYNKVEFRNLTELILLKGNKCQCIQSCKDENIYLNQDQCGEYCKRLGPQQERDIIKQLIIKENESFIVQDYGQLGSPSLGNINHSNHKILAPSSRSRSPAQNIEDLNYKTQQQNRRDEKKYLINAKWWRSWCDYVNFEATTPKKQKENLEMLNEKYKENGEKRQIILNLKNVKNQVIQKTSQLPGSNYPKPSKIMNVEILKDGKQCEIKDDLVEHFDFIAVSCEVWKHLYSWYSADWTIMRFMKRDKTNKRAYFLDLYPEKNAISKYMIEHESEQFESESEFSQYLANDEKALQLRDLT